MKTFTRIFLFFLLACSLCWNPTVAQNTCDSPLTINCGDVVFGSTQGIANDVTTSGAGTCITTVGTGGQNWYSFTPPSGGTCTMSMTNANTIYDTKIHVYTGTCGALTCVTGNDDFVGLQSQVTFNITMNTTYLVRVGGYLANEGSFELDVSCDLDSDGCTDNTACNYDNAATNDDGSCCYGICETLVVDGGNFDTEVHWTLLDPLGNTIQTGGAPYTGFVCLPSADCGYQFVMTDDFGDGWNGNTYTFSDGNGNVEATGTLADGLGPETAILALGGLTSGCMDQLASNYDPGATCDDGSCLYCIGGEQVFNFNMTSTFGGWFGSNYILLDENSNVVFTGTMADGTLTDVFSACLAPGCYSINVSAGGFATAVGWSITDLAGNEIVAGGADETFGFPWGGQTGCVIDGCTDAGCNNYNPFATNDDGTCICPPANDDCANAQAIQCGASITGTTINANDDGAIPTCTGVAVTSPGVWYTFIGTGDQVQLSTCNSTAGTDTEINVYTGSCGNFNCVAANDEGCANFGPSNIAFTTQIGLAYYVIVTEFGTFGTGIDFTLDVTCIDCNGSPFNDVCDNALPLPEGVVFPGNLCCANVDPEIAPWDFFGSEYGIWYVINSGDANVLDVAFWNGSGEGADAGDGANVGIGVYEGGGGCANLNALVGGVGFDGNPLDGFLFNSYEFGIPILPNTDYYFLLVTSDPVNCGDFVLSVDLTCAGCTDPNADNYSPDCTVDDGSCTYTGAPANDLCANAQTIVCNSTVSASTGAATNTGAPAVCPDGANDAGVWYTFTGDGQFVNLSTCGSPIDSRIMVVSSANGCAGPYTCVISEDNDATDAGCGFFDGDDASVGFVSVVGTTYYVYITAGAIDSDGDGVNDLFDGAFTLDFTCGPVVEGCQDACACNFDPNANVDSGDCDYFTCANCGTGTTAVQIQMTDAFGDGWNGGTYSVQDGTGNVVASGDIDNSQCNQFGGFGGGIIAGFNVFCLADGCYTMTLGGSTFPGEMGYMVVDADGNILVPTSVGANTFEFGIGGGVCGCTDPGACNYDQTANIDNGTCDFDSCSGCMDNTVCSYDASATIDDPTQCCFENCVSFIMNSGLFNGGWSGSIASVIDNSNGLVVATATLPVGSAAGTVLFCLPNGCYTLDVSAGTASFAVSWTLAGINGGLLNGGAPTSVDFSVGTGVDCTPSCTEPIACNYNPDAYVSDCNVCEYQSCLGCTYLLDVNYTPGATIDDGSCSGNSSGQCCMFDSTGDGLVGVGDLLDFLSAFGQPADCN